jgi:hypothetical protein
MALTPLELGPQPLASRPSDQKKTPTEKGETPHRVDAIVLLKMLFLARVVDDIRQERDRVYIKWLRDQAFSFYSFDKCSL